MQGKTLEFTGVCNAFLSRNPIAQEITRIEKWIVSNYKASLQQRKKLLE
jgi:hypothetical protein